MAVVYIHKKKTDGTIFYIGIGSRKQRAYSVHRRNQMWNSIVKKHGYHVYIVLEDITIEEAKYAEKYLIKYYGRRDTNQGDLCNLTDGGDGVHGYIYTQEHKDKVSSWTKGRVCSLETKEKMANSHKGMKHKEQSKLKMRLAKIGTIPHNKGKKTDKPSHNAKEVILFDKEGVQIESFPNTYKAAEYVDLSQAIVFKNCKHLKKMRDGRYFRYK